MTTIYIIAREAWKRIPAPIQRLIRVIKPLNTVKKGINKLLSPEFKSTENRSHNEIYSADYFYIVDEEAKRGANIIAHSITKYFHPRSVMDVGCGTGTLMESLRALGVIVNGLEYSEAALQICRKRNLEVQKFDLENDILSNYNSVDLVVSTEVAEHLPEIVADRYVDLLTSLSDKVIFTAATPGQGGHNHVNEQPHAYWIAKFSTRGYQFDKTLSEQWRSDWTVAEVPYWYSTNLMIFKKQ